MSGTFSVSNLQMLADQAAQQYGVPQSLFEAQLGQESSWNPNAVNGTAAGIAQFEPGTAQQFGIDPYNPSQAIPAAAQYDSQLYQQTGSWVQALQGYGTLPASGGLSSGQQGVFNLAQAADGGGAYGGAAPSFLSQVAQFPAGVLSPIGSNVSTGGASSSGGNQGSSGLGAYVTEIAVRIGLVVMGLIFFLGAFYLLGQRDSNLLTAPVSTGAKLGRKFGKRALRI